MKIRNIKIVGNFLEWLDEKHFHIGDLEFGTWIIWSAKGEEREIDFDPDCEHCIFGWESRSYEGECEDCGCYIDYEFNTPKFFCALPWRIKHLIKKIKRWD